MVCEDISVSNRRESLISHVMEEKLILVVSQFPELFDRSLRSYGGIYKKVDLETNYQQKCFRIT